MITAVTCNPEVRPVHVPVSALALGFVLGALVARIAKHLIAVFNHRAAEEGLGTVVGVDGVVRRYLGASPLPGRPNGLRTVY